MNIDIDGNERVGELRRKGSKTPFAGLNPELETIKLAARRAMQDGKLKKLVHHGL